MRTKLDRVLPYSPEQLFTLVGDVEAYPQYLPGIEALRTWNPRTLPTGVEQFDAEVAVRYKFVREKFATRVQRDPAARTIVVDLLYGPLRRLKNRWAFEPEGEGTRVRFEIDFEFKVPMLAALMAANFEEGVDKVMRRFEERARVLYGAGT